MTSPLPELVERQRRISVEEYHRMIDTQPDAQEGCYRSRVVRRAGEEVAAGSLPGLIVPVSELFL